MPRTSKWFSNNGAKCAVITLLALPTALPFFIHSRQVQENRSLAPRPSLPETWTQFLMLPTQTDAWIKDHFGFRAELVEANNFLRFKTFHEFPSVQVSTGENGRIFVTAHATAAPPFSAVADICDVNRQSLKQFGSYLNILFDGFEVMGHAPKLMIVPSAPTVQSADLPHWMRERCSSNNTPTMALLESDYINDNVKKAIYYPLALMRANNQGSELFPKTWFHWNGPGLEHVAQDSMGSLFPAVRSAAPRLRTHTTVQESDVAQMFPGIDLPSTISEPDFAASHISACHGTTCFPEFKGFAEPLYDASRYHNPAAPARRLLILSDSFGRFISGWYSRYYRTVEHVAVNNVRDLKHEQIKIFRDFLLREPANTDVLFIFHDGALSGTLRLGLQRLHRDGAGDQAELHHPADYTMLAQQVYISYLGRPADLAGLQSLQRQLSDAGAPLDLQQLNLAYANNAGVRDLIDSFGNSAESKALYPENGEAFVAAIYRQMFNRQPDPGGLRYWTSQLESGQLSRGRAALSIASAALAPQTLQQGLLDSALIRRKFSYSVRFTSALSNAGHQCYAGAPAAAKARAQISAIKTDDDARQFGVLAAKMSGAACE